MRAVVWTLARDLPGGRAEEIVAGLRERGLAAEVREFPTGAAVVVADPPDDLVAPDGVARAGSVDVPATGEMTRRAVLEAFALAIGAATVGAACGVAGAFASASSSAGEAPDEVDAASTAELRANGAKRFSFGREPCIVILQGERIHALSLVCTHLGCLVEWSRDGRQLRCPCHNGAFDVEGRVLYGPPPRPLETYDAVVRGDRVWVRRRARA